MLTKFSQVKLSSIKTSNISSLFKIFRFNQAFRKAKMKKAKGYSFQHMLFTMLLLILQSDKSIFHGLSKLFNTKLKTPINDMLNNSNYNWRNFLYSIAKRFMFLSPSKDDPYLIFDDTAKEKSGTRGENLTWFHNHCEKRFFKGFQNITMAWFNGKTVIPVDFEMKIGNSKVKHSKQSNYKKRSHMEQRTRFSKRKKNSLVIQMIKRAMKRQVKFKYILWDSWFTSSKTINFLFQRLVPKGKILISMLKNNQTKYRLNRKNSIHFLNLKELKNKAGKWIIDTETGIKHKVLNVGYLDVNSSSKISKRKVIGTVKIGFYRYPNMKGFRAIISTDTELSAMEILNHYLKRWSIECLFKDIKQHFGYAQNKASKYSSMVGDMSIRYAFYILFCYKKEQINNDIAQKKSMGQIVLEFYQEIFEICLNEFIEIMFRKKLQEFLLFARESRIKNIDEIMLKYDRLIENFFKSVHYSDKIEEASVNDLKLKKSKIA
jgi:hypothetical protein